MKSYVKKSKKYSQENPKPEKKLGQHFLSDRSKQMLICKDFAEEAQVIIEVGPGPGALTAHLSQLKKPYWVIETDERFAPLLQKFISDEAIIIEDALAFDWNGFITKQNFKNTHIWLVSNLPYNISVPLLLQFIQVPEIKYMTLMFQLEVGEKLLSTPGEMNSLEVLASTQFEIKKLATLTPGCFSPAPKVDSIVLSFRRRVAPLIPLSEWKALEQFGRNIFQLRRKQLQGVLKTVYPKLTTDQESGKSSSDTILEHLENCKIPSKERAHNLNLTQVLDLYHLIRNKK